MAFNVSSSEDPVSKVTIKNVLPVFAFINASFMSFGSASIGVDKSATESYQTTFFTWSTFFIFSSSSTTCFSSIFSTIHIEKAPVPKSFFKISWPSIVSMSDGKYERIS